MQFSFSFSRGKKTLAASTPDKKRVLPNTLKAVSRMRADIKVWNDAYNQAMAEEAKNFALQLLYNEARIDALLTSQVENRQQQIFSIPFKLKSATGEVDEEQTALLSKMPIYRQLCKAVLDSVYYGYNLVELELSKTDAGIQANAIVLPRTNVVPQLGLYFKDYSEDTSIKYREMPEYGTYILEFNTGDLGLLNKAVPHVLFKRFAQSCWSELCEIYGIPPRYMKTNTQDPTMLKRAESMMSDMGAAAWFIIDEEETFEFAKVDSTNGDVYKNLIALCNNEISLLVSGAVIGQDTVNGNRSKEDSSQNMLFNLVKADMALIEQSFNSIILPALAKLGLIKPGIMGEFEQVPDLESLWKYTSGALQYFNVDPEWIKKTFGIEVTGERATPATDPAAKQKLQLSDFFG
jgi:hypothetical protein